MIDDDGDDDDVVGSIPSAVVTGQANDAGNPPAGGDRGGVSAAPVASRPRRSRARKTSPGNTMGAGNTAGKTAFKRGGPVKTRFAMPLTSKVKSSRKW